MARTPTFGYPYVGWAATSSRRSWLRRQICCSEQPKEIVPTEKNHPRIIADMEEAIVNREFGRARTRRLCVYRPPRWVQNLRFSIAFPAMPQVSL